MKISHKINLSVSLLLLITFIVSCTPGTVVSTPAAIPTPTITPTPAPQSLADAPDLPTWVDDYAHAYDGMVTINGVEMDAELLTAAIRQNPDVFTRVKQINNVDTFFLEVNGCPLAYKDNQGYWKETTLKLLNTASGRNMGTQLIGNKLNDPAYTNAMLKSFDYVTIDGPLNTDVLLPDGKEIQLLNMVSNNEDLSNVDSIFYWQDSDYFVEYANTKGLKVQGHHLFVNWSNLTDEIKTGLRSGEISYDDYEKFLKIYIQTVVRHYDQENLKIDEWTATNEVASALLWSDDKDILHELFINRHLMTKLCLWVKEIDPQIRTIVSEDHLFENQTSGLLDSFISIVKTSLSEGAPIDEIGIQNHLWVYSFPTEAEIDTALGKLNELGLPITSTEMTISISNTDFFSAGVGKRWDIENKNLLLEQTKAYSLIFLKLKKNALFGFTDALSCFSLQGDDAYDPTAKALILDEDIRPKQAYYGISKVIYDYLP